MASGPFNNSYVTRPVFMTELISKSNSKCINLKVIYKGCFKFFVALYADRICSDQHFVENCIEKFPSV